MNNNPQNSPNSSGKSAKGKKIPIIIVSILIIAIIVLIAYNLIPGSKNKSAVQSNVFSVRIGLLREPRALCPVKRNGNIERQVNQYTFIQAADYNPFTLQNTPVFIENIPKEISIDSGKYANTFRYDLTFRKEAKWDDGSEITGFDQLFFIKMILNPMVEIHPAVRNLYKKVKGIEIDKENPKKISIYTDKNYMLSRELVTNMEIFPEYFYDPGKIMRKINFETFLDEKKLSAVLDTLPGSKKFAEKINSAYFMREHISGQGPYYLADWEANSFIRLKRKDNYWGEKFTGIPYLQNNPKEIIFKIIADKTTSLTELKNGNIDVLQSVPGNDFKKMKNDSVYSNKFDFHNPLSMQFYYVIINNRNPVLKDKNIRKALAYLTDVDFLIKTFGTGGEKRLTSPVHPSKPYYYKKLKPVKFDIVKAKELLNKSGWKDTDNNGILDKIVNGKRTELNLTFVAKGNGLGKNIGLLMQENAKKAGISIEVISKSSKEFRNILKKREFDLVPSVISEDLADVDPYWDWHSDNIGPGGSNISGFSDDKCDSIIREIRNTRDIELRRNFYKILQILIYEKQPVIFLYVPTNNIIINKKFKAKTSIKRPGYFANTFELTKEKK
ncbi:MAG TPA: hypothetical protein ENI82_03750 [Bacteroidetes bacterium]|nr:hypothetical protein [Bacteroidota bacterium]